MKSVLFFQTTEDCSSKVSQVIEFMDSYHFVKEDWDSIMEVGQFDGKRKPQGDIDSKVGWFISFELFLLKVQ